jgi:aminoglycoside phosphotransferase (APT) family kinase protein
VTDEGWRSRVRGVLTDRDGQVLVLGSGEGTSLPTIELDGYTEHALEDVRRGFAELLGTPVAILRYVARSSDSENKRLAIVYALERLDTDWNPPPGATWLDRGALDGDLRELVPERAPVPAKRAPWAQEEWLAEATAWIESSLRSLGRTPTGPVEQVRTWPLSAVLRVPTQEGRVYFKATSTSPLFVDEGRVMQGLARLFRHEVPNPLAIDSPRRWMLLEDVGESIGWDAPVEERESALRVFAFMQVASSSELDALLAMGCIDRRSAWLAREAQELISDDAAVAGLEDDEIVRLRELEPVLVALCLRLAERPVPDALVHGDLHLDNVARVGGRYVFFDWSDACVTHPFLDLIDVHREEDPVVQARLRDAYLSVWSDYASPADLLALWELSAPLASLNQAVSYRHILASVECGSVQNLDWALPHWLRLVLGTDFDSLQL